VDDNILKSILVSFSGHTVHYCTVLHFNLS